MSAFVLILAIFPSFIWLFFYLQEERHSEPKRFIAATFIAGGAVTVLAFAAQVLVGCAYLNYQNLPCQDVGVLTKFLPFVIIFAAIEEIAKFGAAYFILRSNPVFNTPVDAMIYTTTAGLGFAAVENLGALSQPYMEPIMGPLIQLILLRFIGATLLHALASGLAGYFWALSIREFQNPRHIVIGLLAATGLHAIFNYFILLYGNPMLIFIFLMISGFYIISDFEKLRLRSV